MLNANGVQQLLPLCCGLSVLIGLYPENVVEFFMKDIYIYFENSQNLISGSIFPCIKWARVAC